MYVTEQTFNCSKWTIRYSKKRCEICLNLTIEIPEWRQFIVDFSPTWSTPCLMAVYLIALIKFHLLLPSSFHTFVRLHFQFALIYFLTFSRTLYCIKLLISADFLEKIVLDSWIFICHIATLHQPLFVSFVHHWILKRRFDYHIVNEFCNEELLCFSKPPRVISMLFYLPISCWHFLSFQSTRKILL